MGNDAHLHFYCTTFLNILRIYGMHYRIRRGGYFFPDTVLVCLYIVLHCSILAEEITDLQPVSMHIIIIYNT